MAQQTRRSKRQLYLGFFFVTLAIVVAVARTMFGPTPVQPGTSDRSESFIGVTIDEAIATLGEPTTRAEFYADESFHPDRSAMIQGLERSGEPVPEVFVELAWFTSDEVLTVRFPAAVDENGEVSARGPSLDATRLPVPEDRGNGGQ